MFSISRSGLIAAREFKAYVATVSFWVALLVAPLAMGGALLLGGLGGSNAAPAPVAVLADDARMGGSAAAALAQAARLEGHAPPQLAGGPAAAAIRISRAGDGDIDVRFDGPVPLSPEGRALVTASIQRDAAMLAQGRALLGKAPQAVAAPAAAKPPAGPLPAARFGLVALLWLTLTGSLGMLLQAVVRERSNRALETLLAAAQPIEIVAGKLAGVGGVSLLVLLAWLGSGAALSALVPAAGVVGVMLAPLAQPGLVAYAVVVYLLAFLLFGFVTVAVGAAAADTAAAQNLSRPMFAVLLAVFFAALSAAGGASGHLAWLVYAPPFTPFMLLLKPEPWTVQVVAFTLLLVSITAVGVFASRNITLKTRGSWLAPRATKQSKPTLA